MSYDRNSFRNYVELDEPKTVRFGNNQFGEGLGVGDILVQSNVEGLMRMVILKQVLFIPSLTRKLLSVSSATERVNKGDIESNKIIIKDNRNKPVIVDLKQGRLYKDCLIEIKSEANTVVINDELKLWLSKMGHVRTSIILSWKRLSQSRIICKMTSSSVEFLKTEQGLSICSSTAYAWEPVEILTSVGRQTIGGTCLNKAIVAGT